MEIKFNKAVSITLLSSSLVPVNGISADRKVREHDNLVFILVDQLRYDALSCMGNQVIDTPNLDRLASEGVLFRRAYSECAVSVPARSSLLTGCTIYNTGVTGNNVCYESKGQLTGKEPIWNMMTYDEVLMKNGYTGEYYGKWHSPEFRAYAYGNRPIGLAGSGGHEELGIGLASIYTEWLNKVAPEKEKEEGDLYYKPMDRYYAPDPFDPKYNGGTASPGQKSQVYSLGLLRVTEEQTRTAMDSKSLIGALKRLKEAGRPFTVHCSYGPPHPPLMVCEKYHSMLDAEEMEMVDNFNERETSSPYYGNIKRSTYFQDEDRMKYMVRNYWAMVKELDDWLGEVFRTIEEEGLKDNTMIVFTADHGKMLGAHGLNGTANFYEEAARVPLIISYPGKIRQGTVVEAPVNTIGLYATILDYLGVKEGQTHKPDEPSLRRFIENPELAGSENVFAISEWPSDSVPGEMIRTMEWKLMIGRSRDSGCTDALYDMKNDPLETKNLLASPDAEKYLPVARKLQKMLGEHLDKTGSPYAEGVLSRELKVYTISQN